MRLLSFLSILFSITVVFTQSKSVYHLYLDSAIVSKINGYLIQSKQYVLYENQPICLFFDADKTGKIIFIDKAKQIDTTIKKMLLDYFQTGFKYKTLTGSLISPISLNTSNENQESDTQRYSVTVNFNLAENEITLYSNRNHFYYNVKSHIKMMLKIINSLIQNNITLPYSENGLLDFKIELLPGGKIKIVDDYKLEKKYATLPKIIQDEFKWDSIFYYDKNLRLKNEQKDLKKTFYILSLPLNPNSYLLEHHFDTNQHKIEAQEMQLNQVSKKIAFTILYKKHNHMGQIRCPESDDPDCYMDVLAIDSMQLYNSAYIVKLKTNTFNSVQHPILGTLQLFLKYNSADTIYPYSLAIDKNLLQSNSNNFSAISTTSSQIEINEGATKENSNSWVSWVIKVMMLE